jgi:biopolymer transport protein ExbD
MSQMQVWRPAGESASQNDSPLELMRVTVYDGYYALNDTRASLGTLERTFNRLADLNPTQSIIVVATADSRHKDLVEALDLLNKAGLENVSLLSSE